MIVEEVEMTPRQTNNFRQCIIDKLRIETATSGKKGIFVAEGAVVRAASRYHDRIGHEVAMPLNQIPPDWRKTFQGTHRRFIPALRSSRRQVAQKLREDVLTWAQEDGVGVRRRFIGKRRYVQAAEHDVRAT